MKMEFLTIDVETANEDLSSICQIGIATFENGALSKEWSTLINPNVHFSPINSRIHGITPEEVKSAPTFAQVLDQLREMIEGKTIFSHTHFDKTAISKAYRLADSTLPSCTWLDSSRVARSVWPEFRENGYSLKSLAKALSISFKHHDALEDAKAAGAIILEATKATNISIQDLEDLTSPRKQAPNHVELTANPNGPLTGEHIVFTGTLSIPRKEASVIASNLGCQVSSGVTKKTSIVVVGDQDLHKVDSSGKSSKHQKAEKLAEKGQKISILSESDFKELSKTNW